MYIRGGTGVVMHRAMSPMHKVNLAELALAPGARNGNACVHVARLVPIGGGVCMMGSDAYAIGSR